LASAADRAYGEMFATRSEVIAPHGMVATRQPLASQIGLEVLKQGGSAVDAAIAANAALGLMCPNLNGIGGDLFAIVWDPETQQLYGLNASGRSPQAMTREVLSEEGIETAIPMLGKFSVSVPGCVDGWFELHSQFGELPMTSILKPAIDYARDGFPVSQMVAEGWAASVNARSQRDDQPGFLETFSIDGRSPRKGKIWKNPALADTLERIANEGRDVFYQGEIADQIDATLQLIGAYLRKGDLEAHQSEWVDPVSTNYRGWEVWELPPNGQGIAALQMLNILEGFDLSKFGFGSVAHLHAFIEAKKLAYEDRAKFYADPAFSEIPLTKLLSKTYAEKRRALINPDKSAKEYAPGVMQHGDTVYLCAADSNGMMVSLIQSNFWGFGSGVCLPELGFGLQNRGASFTLESGHANEYEPGKRPFHTIIPAFVTEDGRPLLAFGVMGGQMQPQGHVQIISNLKDFGMNLQEAGDAPRLNHYGSTQPYGDEGEMVDGGRVYFESDFDISVIRDLRRMGHDMRLGLGHQFGGYQAIYRDPATGVYHGASESRNDGQAVGY